MLCGFCLAVADNLNKVTESQIITYNVALVSGFNVKHALELHLFNLVSDMGTIYLKFKNRICPDK